jgi:peptide deformylase
MSCLPIRIIPDAVLRAVAAPVTNFDQQLKKLIAEMRETMYEAPGIGLAAPQVGVSSRVFVMDVSEDRSGFAAFVNPEIISRAGKEQSEEGCLSIPGFRETIQRSKKVVVRAQTETGEWFECEAEELEAFCVQHELDHLNGVLFTDHLSRLKKPIFNEWLLENGISKP